MSARKTIDNARILAVQCALEVTRSGLLIPEAMTRLRTRLSQQDLELAHELCYGTFRYLPGLTRFLETFCKTGKLPDPIRWLLLISLYQLRFTRIPDYAVLDEANKLAARLSFPGLRRLVNGVLRNVQRKGDAVWQDLSPSEQLLPDWLDQRLIEAYGEATRDGWVIAWQNRPGTSYWTVGDQPIGAEDTQSPHLPHAFRNGSALDPRTLGSSYIQNESSQAIAELARRLKPDAVLDLCAAPGGKSLYLAAFGDQTRLIANDNAPDRLARLEENRERLGLTLETTRSDAESLEFGADFDLVLVDAPCTGIGIIGRHPEIKCLKHGPADAVVLERQRTIVAAAVRMLAPGGHLLYSACSLDPAEVPEQPEELLPARETLAEMARDLPIVLNDTRFTIPPADHFDGFVGALWQKPEI